jgi:hypothetical protein
MKPNDCNLAKARLLSCNRVSTRLQSLAVTA